MAITPEQARRELARRELERRKAAKPSSILSKANNVALNVAQTGMEALAAPFELAGEAIRAPLEQDAPRAPSILQRFAPSTKTERPPVTPFEVGNRLLRAAAGGAAGIPSGTPLESARAAYHADRGILGNVEDFAASALVGRISPKVANAPTEAAIEGIASAAEKAKNATGFLGKKAIRAGLGPTEEAQAALFNRPQAVKNAPSKFDDLADDFATTLNGLQKRVESLDDEAWGSLLKLKAEPRSKIIQFLKDTKSEIKVKGGGAVGDADRRAIATLDRLIDDVKAIKQPGSNKQTEQMLDQQQIRQIILAARRNINWQDDSATTTNNAIKTFQGKLDSYLKKENDEYENIMKPLAAATDALESAASKFRVGAKPGKGFVSSDTAAQKLSLVGGEKKPETNRILENLKRETGRDFQDEARLTRFKSEFKPGRQQTAGSRRAVAGGVIGEAAGRMVGLPPVFGGAAGAATGASLDYYGGSIAAKIIEALSQGGTKTGELMKAARQGAKRTNLDLLLELARKYSPAISTLQGAR